MLVAEVVAEAAKVHVIQIADLFASTNVQVAHISNLL